MSPKATRSDDVGIWISRAFRARLSTLWSGHKEKMGDRPSVGGKGGRIQGKTKQRNSKGGQNIRCKVQAQNLLSFFLPYEQKKFENKMYFFGFEMYQKKL